MVTLTTFGEPQKDVFDDDCYVCKCSDQFFLWTISDKPVICPFCGKEMKKYKGDVR